MDTTSVKHLEAELRQQAALLSQGEMEALGEVYDVVGARLLRYATFLLRDRMLAEDVLQSALLRLARFPRKLAKARHPLAYLFRIVRNESYTYLKRKSPAKSNQQLEGLTCCRSIPIDLWEISEKVHDALSQLPQMQAEVITLRIWEGLTFREIAEITGESLNTITSRYRYGIEKLSSSLKSFGGDDKQLPLLRMNRNLQRMLQPGWSGSH